ncbi:pro-resilin-like [Procambarus clarkii]|uniref:pro-resilin-like n=1 Tax=Procambarus clarkii TaxID=6728 RepID=UPI00374442DF
MSTKVLVLAAIVAATLARPEPPPAYGPPPAYPRPSYGAPAYPDTPPRYDSQYAVSDGSGNDFGHQESRNDYDTKGSYYVQLPDGRLQKVTYVVNGDSGYVAQVEYQGDAQYPAYQPSYKPAPAYKPAPVYA